MLELLTAIDRRAKYLDSAFGIPPSVDDQIEAELARLHALGEQGRQFAEDCLQEVLNEFPALRTNPEFAP